MASRIQSLSIVDNRTGEKVVDEVLFLGKNPKFLDKGYIKVFTTFLPDVIESDRLAGKSIRLLFYMLQSLNYDSLEMRVIPRYAVETLSINRRTYNRWLNDLVEFGLIEKIDTYTYRLKPFTFVRGSHEKAVTKELKRRLRESRESKQKKSKSKKEV